MPRRACRKDANHDEIAEAFRKLGWWWLDTWQFAQYVPGFFDGMAILHDRVVGIEIKTKKGELTDDEVTFQLEYPGWQAICKTVDDVIEIDRYCREVAKW